MSLKQKNNHLFYHHINSLVRCRRMPLTVQHRKYNIDSLSVEVTVHAGPRGLVSFKQFILFEGTVRFLQHAVYRVYQHPKSIAVCPVKCFVQPLHSYHCLRVASDSAVWYSCNQSNELVTHLNFFQTYVQIYIYIYIYIYIQVHRKRWTGFETAIT